MLVFWKERLILFSVPKTGTTAFEGHLAPRASLVIRDPPAAKHTPVYRYRRFLKPYLEALDAVEFETVAVVREPESWLGSWYRYRSREDLIGSPNSTSDLSFEQFVQAYLQGPGQRPPFAQVGSQAKFLTRGSDDPKGVDHLFAYDRIDLFKQFLEQRLGTTLNPPRTNVSPDLPLGLSDTTRQKLKRKARREYEVYAAAHRGEA